MPSERLRKLEIEANAAFDQVPMLLLNFRRRLGTSEVLFYLASLIEYFWTCLTHEKGPPLWNALAPPANIRPGYKGLLGQIIKLICDQ
jgi:hypothetical protein